MPLRRRYDELLARQLGTGPSGFVRAGAALGARVAKEVLAWRQNDHWTDPFLPYVEPLLPGRWQPTPPNNPSPDIHPSPGRRADGAGAPTQYLAIPPPLTSEQ